MTKESTFKGVESVKIAATAIHKPLQVVKSRKANQQLQ